MPRYLNGSGSPGDYHKHSLWIAGDFNSMSNTSANLIIFGVLLTLIGVMGTFSDSLLAGAIPAGTLPALSSVKVYVFEPILGIGVILLVIGIFLQVRKPGEE